MPPPAPALCAASTCETAFRRLESVGFGLSTAGGPTGAAGKWPVYSSIRFSMWLICY